MKTLRAFLLAACIAPLGAICASEISGSTTQSTNLPSTSATSETPAEPAESPEVEPEKEAKPAPKKKEKSRKKKKSDPKKSDDAKPEKNVKSDEANADAAAGENAKKPAEKSDKKAKDAKPAGNAAKPDGEPSPEMRALQKQLSELALQKNLIEARLALEEARQREAVISARKKLGALNVDALAKDAVQNEEKSRIENALSLEASRANARLAAKTARVRELEAETRILKTEQENASLRDHAELARVNARIAAFEKKRATTRIALNARPQYPKNPLVNGTLYISDRRIALNGVVTLRMAEQAIERINFFNNQSSEHPIFLVIDRSPGGSVAAGFQILKAMESSKAPVHVVVKGYAASMAAVITTLAKHSYAYNNTIILHHQMSTLLYGNMSDLEDQMKMARNWYSRLATAVAKKMGISLDEFTKQMYANAASGDWEEFGDHAKKLKWVDNIVERIVETGIVDIRASKEPKQSHPNPFFDPDEASHKLDEKGRPYIQLPVLDAFDAWWIYDKRSQYRAW